MSINNKRTRDSIDLINDLKRIDYHRNISIINLIKNGLEFEYEKDGDAYFFRFKRNRDDEFRVYFCASNIEELNKMKKYLKSEDNTFASIPKWIIPEISKGRKILWQDSAYKFILTNDIEVDDVEVPGSNFLIEKIKEDDFVLIDKLWSYRDEKSIKYISSRIESGISGGIYINGEIAAWCLTHFDNSLAHLFVLDKFRRKNLAFKLLHFMSKKIRETGRIPYLYSVKDNISAHKLFYKYGYTRVEEVCWFGME